MLTASARFNSLESGLDSIKASNSSIKRTIHYYLSFSHIIPDCYIGNLLSQRTGWKFYEGDSFHPPENIAKMSQGTPLTDNDRLPWLLALKDLIHPTLPNKKNIIIACSALKSAYRQILQGEHEEIIWVYLQGNYPEILARMKQRQGHFMKEEMLQSQFQILEEPEQALKVDISLPPEAIVDKIVAYLNKVIS